MDLKKKISVDLRFPSIKTAQRTTPDFPGLSQISDRSTTQFNN